MPITKSTARSRTAKKPAKPKVSADGSISPKIKITSVALIMSGASKPGEKPIPDTGVKNKMRYKISCVRIKNKISLLIPT
jgi:hypothetical protein